MANLNLKVFNQAGEEVSTVSLDKSVFGIEPHESTMFDAVLVYRANMRQATAKTKVRHEVSGGGKQPWRQKGTGRARAGSSRSPLWVGGGTVFGPTGEQNFKLKQNKKEHNLALRSAYSALAKKDLIVLDSLNVSGKTKEIVSLLTALKVNDKKVVLVSDDDKVLQAASNLPNVITRANDNVSVYDLLNADKVVATKDDVKKIEEELK